MLYKPGILFLKRSLLSSAYLYLRIYSQVSPAVVHSWYFLFGFKSEVFYESYFRHPVSGWALTILKG